MKVSQLTSSRPGDFEYSRERAVTDTNVQTTELGYQWASTLLAFLALMMMPFRKSSLMRIPGPWFGVLILARSLSLL